MANNGYLSMEIDSVNTEKLKIIKKWLKDNVKLIKNDYKDYEIIEKPKDKNKVYEYKLWAWYNGIIYDKDTEVAVISLSTKHTTPVNLGIYIAASMGIDFKGYYELEYGYYGIMEYIDGKSHHIEEHDMWEEMAKVEYKRFKEENNIKVLNKRQNKKLLQNYDNKSFFKSTVYPYIKENYSDTDIKRMSKGRMKRLYKISTVITVEDLPF